MLAFAILSEQLYLWFGIEPFFTQLEVNISSITNTYSIERAKKDLGYKPINNHDLTSTIEYYKKLKEKKKNSNSPTSITDNNKIILLVSLFFIILFWLINKWM